MAITVAELNVELLADIRKLQSGLDRAEAEVKKFAGTAEKSAAKVEASVGKTGKAMGGIGSFLAVDALFGFAMAAMEAVDATSELGKEWSETKDKIQQGKAAIGAELIPAVASFVNWADEAIQKTKEWGDSILSVGGTIENVDKKAVARGGIGAWIDQLIGPLWGEAETNVKKVELATDTLSSTQKFSGETVQELLGILEEENKILSDQRKVVDDAEKAWGKLKDAQMAAKDAAFALEDANLVLADAQDELNELLATGGVDMEKVADATENLVRVNGDLADANKNLADAQQDYNDALADAKDRHLREVTRATDDLTDAQQRLREETQDVTDAQAKLAKLKAQKKARDDAIKAAKAQLAAADTVTERIIAQDALNAALGMEIVTDEEIAAAAGDVTVQQDEVKTATDGVAQASRNLMNVQAKQPEDYDNVKRAGERLTDAQSAVASATSNVTAAQLALNQAQQPAPGFANEVEEATRAVERAYWGVEKATWAAEKAQRAYNEALIDQPSSVTTTRIINDQVNVKVDMVPISVAPQPGAGAVVPLQMRPTLVMHDGGIVPGPRGSEVPALLQAGEQVIPAGRSGGGSDRPIVVQLVADGKVIQEILLAHQRRSGALGFRQN